VSFESITDPEKQTVTETDLEVMELEKSLSAGANWFIWIAGLSLINSLIAIFEGAWSFIVGLGITQVFDAFAVVIGESTGSMAIAKTLAFCLDVAVAFVLVMIAILAKKRMGWAFLVGMVFYIGDAGIFVLVGDWLSVGFHAFALYGIFSGYRALNNLKRLQPDGPAI